MKIKLNNYEYIPKQVISYLPPKKYVPELVSAGFKVITSAKSLNYYKILWACLYNTAKPYKAVIIYTNPDTSGRIKGIVEYCMEHNIDVFYRTNCIPGVKPVYEEYISTKTVFYNKKPSYKLLKTTDAVKDNLNYHYHKDTTEKEQATLIKYLNYYDIELPQSDIEWVMIKQQINYYLDNDIDYAFDKSQRYICPECGALAYYNLEHICYDFTEEEKTKLDYIVNGGE